MAKKDNEVKKVDVTIEGMRCYQKLGGGTLRISNRIIKPGQNFWIAPESIPTGFKSYLKEVPADPKAVVVTTVVPAKPRIQEAEIVAEKFEMVEATDENGEVIMKGETPLYNVIGEDKKPMNDKPLRKAKAEELLNSLNS